MDLKGKKAKHRREGEASCTTASMAKCNSTFSEGEVPHEDRNPWSTETVSFINGNASPRHPAGVSITK